MMAVAVVLCSAWAAPAGAYVYWSNAATGTIGRANLDGTGAVQDFIRYAGGAGALAVNDRYIYWTSPGAHSIGRADLDGSHANPSFMYTQSTPTGVALDEDHVYWTGPGSGVSRANLDGSNPITAYFTVPNTWALAIAGSDFYATSVSTSAGSRVWGGWLSTRASEYGRFATDTGSEGGLAANRNFVYWANPSAGTIGRADPNGAGLNAGFITGASGPRGVAVDTEHVFWTNRDTGRVGRANLDGSGADQRFIAGASSPSGIAVDRGPAGSPSPSAESVTFRPQSVGTLGSPLAVEITNTGHGDLTIDAARSIGDEFVMTFDDCSHSTLAVGARCLLKLRFAPSQTGQRSGAIRITGKGSDSVLSVWLFGTGITPSPGPPGPPGQVVLVSCTTVGDNTVCSPVLSGTAKLATAGTARATLTRHGTLYASGTARRSRVKLRARRQVAAGRYTLTLRYRRHGRPVTSRTRLTLR